MRGWLVASLAFSFPVTQQGGRSTGRASWTCNKLTVGERGGEGKVKLFPSPAPPSRPLQCVCSFYPMPSRSSYAPPAVWLFDSLYTWCIDTRKAKCVIVSDAKQFVNARNRAEKKTLLAGYAEATYDCTFSILQSVNFKFTIHMLTVLKRLNFEIVVSYGKCVSRK